MELILGISLTVNGFFIGLWLFGNYLSKKEKKIIEREMKKQIEGFTQQYISRYKDIYNA
jgi:hypothetical protein